MTDVRERDDPHRSSDVGRAWPILLAVDLAGWAIGLSAGVIVTLTHGVVWGLLTVGVAVAITQRALFFAGVLIVVAWWQLGGQAFILALIASWFLWPVVKGALLLWPLGKKELETNEQGWDSDSDGEDPADGDYRPREQKPFESTLVPSAAYRFEGEGADAPAKRPLVLPDGERLSVRLTTASCDLRIASELSRDLREIGVDTTTEPSGEESGHVVLISEEAASDQGWRESIPSGSSNRLVPVAVGRVDAAVLPEGPLKALNWIMWDEDAPVAAATSVLMALRADPERYAFHRKLAARAASWVEHERDTSSLIASWRESVQAREHIRDSRGDPLSSPTPLLEEFVEASVSATRALRRIRIRKRLVRAAGVVAVVATAFSVVSAGRSLSDNNRLALIASAGISNDLRPDRLAMVGAAIRLQGDERTEEAARRSILTALAKPWAHGVLGTTNDGALYDVYLIEGAGHAFTIDENGVLTRWDTETAEAVWRRRIGAMPYVAKLDGQPSGSTLAVVSGETLWIVRPEPWAVEEIALPEGVVDVALAGDGTVVLAGHLGSLLVVSPGDPENVREVASGLRFLDFERTTEGDVRALVRERNGAQRLALLDGLTGKTVAATTSLSEVKFERGAIGPDGQAVALTGGDRQIHFAPADLEFQPTGFPVHPPVTVFSLVPDGRIVVGDGALAPRVLDLETGTVVSEICDPRQTDDLVLEPQGRLVACSGQGLVRLWELPLAPFGQEGSRPDSDPFEATNGSLAVKGAKDGRLLVVREVADDIFRPFQFELGEELSVVSVHPENPSVAVGTKAGRVHELWIDVGSDDDVLTAVRQVDMPSGSPVQEVSWRSEKLAEVRTADGFVWPIKLCGKCFTIDGMVAELRERLWPCYVESASHFMSREVRGTLGIRACGSVPAVEN